MRRNLTWMWKTVAAVAVVAGLGFGAQTAMAGERDPCQPCFNEQECEECCDREYGLPGTCVISHQACLCG